MRWYLTVPPDVELQSRDGVQAVGEGTSCGFGVFLAVGFPLLPKRRQCRSVFPSPLSLATRLKCGRLFDLVGVSYGQGCDAEGDLTLLIFLLPGNPHVQHLT